MIEGEMKMAVRTGGTDAKTRHIALGAGGYIVNRGEWNGQRAVFIEPAPVRGPIGERAPDNALSKSAIASGSIIITFCNHVAADVLVDEITKTAGALSDRANSDTPAAQGKPAGEGEATPNTAT